MEGQFILAQWVWARDQCVLYRGVGAWTNESGQREHLAATRGSALATESDFGRACGRVRERERELERSRSRVGMRTDSGVK